MYICIYIHINCRALTVFVSTMIPLGQGFELPSTTDVSINRKICKLEHFLSWESTMCESQLFDPPHLGSWESQVTDALRISSCIMNQHKSTWNRSSLTNNALSQSTADASINRKNSIVL